MSITIENPTAESIYEALKQVPEGEMARLREMLIIESTPVNESDEWSDEDIEDFRHSTNRLIEKRLGPEEHDYD